MSEEKVVRVSDVMKSQFDMIDGKLTVADALKRMKHVETKTLIVDKRHDDDEYGIVLLSDIAKHVLAVDRSPERVNVYEIMTKPVIGGAARYGYTLLCAPVRPALVCHVRRCWNTARWSVS